MNTESPKSSYPKSTKLPSGKSPRLQFRSAEVTQDSEAPEHNPTCPFCFGPIPDLPELVFTENEMFWRGKRINLLPTTQKLFRFLFLRRGRLVAQIDLEDSLGGGSQKPWALSRVYIRSIRIMLRKRKIPITLRNVWNEGYIMTITPND